MVINDPVVTLRTERHVGHQWTVVVQRDWCGIDKAIVPRRGLRGDESASGEPDGVALVHRIRMEAERVGLTPLWVPADLGGKWKSMIAVGGDSDGEVTLKLTVEHLNPLMCDAA